jgi:hypothetical protein
LHDTDPFGHACETWQYGSEGFGKRPSLGSVEFIRGRVDEDWLGDAQPQSSLAMFSDEKLYGTIRQLQHLAPKDPYDRADSLFYAAATNLLWSMGKEKALSMLIDFSRFNDDNPMRETCLFWLVRVLFTSQQGYFAWPRLGAPTPAPPKNIRAWPDYPMLVVDGVPLSVPVDFIIAGEPEPFEAYVRNNRADWVLRRAPVSPSDDPFAALNHEHNDPRWDLLVRRDSEATDPWSVEFNWDVISSVRTVVSPPTEQLFTYPPDFQGAYHKKYLQLGGHWDAKKMRYVRRDGSILPD